MGTRVALNNGKLQKTLLALILRRQHANKSTGWMVVKTFHNSKDTGSVHDQWGSALDTASPSTNTAAVNNTNTGYQTTAEIQWSFVRTWQNFCKNTTEPPYRSSIIPIYPHQLSNFHQCFICEKTLLKIALIMPVVKEIWKHTLDLKLCSTCCVLLRLFCKQK